MIIDFHAHVYPDQIAPKVIKNGNSLHVNNHCDGTAAALKESMADAGVTFAVVLNIATRPGQTKSIVEYARLIQKQEDAVLCPQKLIPFASVHPFEDNWKYWLHEIKKSGFSGIKLHPDYQSFYVDDPRLESFYQEVAALGLITVFHAGFDPASPADHHAAPKRFANVLPLLEQGTTVLAHMGGLEMLEEAYALLCGRNVYFDNSFHFNTIDKEMAKNMFRKHTPERILFGTDSPWASQRTLLDYFRNEFAEGFLAKEDTDKVLWKNAARLLDLDVPEEPADGQL